ncbi:polysaccharide biosynthesis/export family protein [Omnitrophica bacterium]|nr:polysaccharide biosynthesis/export family protein [Candidatus Omnitrophota bacterium]
MKGRLSITEVAKTLGITPRTIMRWEKAGKIKRSKRDWRGWRFYTRDDIEEIRKFHESIYEYNELEGSIVNAAKSMVVIALAITGLLYTSIICAPAYADTENPTEIAETPGVKETAKSVDIVLDELPVADAPDALVSEDMKYTLGPNDVVAIEVRRHPEFSGQYTVNSEGKIEYKFVGDVILLGLTKVEARERLTEILTEYLIDPVIDVQIVAYMSKVFYVVGDVNRPGKFYMRGETISIREAIVLAGLPNSAAATRKCRLITPDDKGKDNYINVNVYSLLYEGNLKENRTMKPGDVLYVPATILAKMIRVISPVTNAAAETVGAAAAGAGAVALAL